MFWFSIVDAFLLMALFQMVQVISTKEKCLTALILNKSLRQPVHCIKEQASLAYPSHQ